MIQITLIVKSFVSYLYSTLSYFIGEETILLYGVVTKTWHFLFSSPRLYRSTQLTVIKISAKKGSGFKRFHVPQISKRKQIRIVTVHVGWLLNTHRWDINRMHFSWFFRWLSILSHHHFIFQLFFLFNISCDSIFSLLSMDHRSNTFMIWREWWSPRILYSESSQILRIKQRELYTINLEIACTVKNHNESSFDLYWYDFIQYHVQSKY